MAGTIRDLEGRSQASEAGDDQVISLRWYSSDALAEPRPVRSTEHPSKGQGDTKTALLSQSESIAPHLAQMLVELVMNRPQSIEQLPNYREIQYRFIQSVLRDTGMTGADILRGGQVFGIDFTRPRAVILVDARTYILEERASPQSSAAPDPVTHRAQHVIASVVSFFDLPSDTICAYVGDGEVAILKASTTQDLSGWVEQFDNTSWGSASWANLTALKRAANDLLTSLRRDLRSDISIGIGRYHPGIQGLARSYQDARTALSLGLTYEGANHVFCLDRLGIASFVGVADEHTKWDLAEHLLSPLDHAAELIETLDVFFAENCGPSTTARRLHIHRNTLRYRLDKISSLTGLDPRTFDDAVQIRLSLVLRRLRCGLS